MAAVHVTASRRREARRYLEAARVALGLADGAERIEQDGRWQELNAARALRTAADLLDPPEPES